jgi:hypothetical protein
MPECSPRRRFITATLQSGLLRAREQKHTGETGKSEASEFPKASPMTRYITARQSRIARRIRVDGWEMGDAKVIFDGSCISTSAWASSASDSWNSFKTKEALAASAHLEDVLVGSIYRGVIAPDWPATTTLYPPSSKVCLDFPDGTAYRIASCILGVIGLEKDTDLSIFGWLHLDDPHPHHGLFLFWCILHPSHPRGPMISLPLKIRAITSRDPSTFS